MSTNSSSPWAHAAHLTGLPSQGMPAFVPRQPTPDEMAEAVAIVTADLPNIEVALRKTLKAMRGMPDVSKKYLLERLVSGWVLGVTDTREEALALTKCLHGAFDVYVTEAHTKRNKV